MLEVRLPGHAAVIRAEHAAIGRAHVIHIGIAGDPGHRGYAPTGDGGPDFPERDARADDHRQLRPPFAVRLLRASLVGRGGCPRLAFFSLRRSLVACLRSGRRAGLPRMLTGWNVFLQRGRVSGCEASGQQADSNGGPRSIEESHSFSSRTLRSVKTPAIALTWQNRKSYTLSTASWRWTVPQPTLNCHPERRTSVRSRGTGLSEACRRSRGTADPSARTKVLGRDDTVVVASKILRI